jgi:hypothetical protein
MLIFWLVVCVLIFAISYYFWPPHQRGLHAITVTAGILGSLVCAGFLIARSIPVTRTETVIKKVVLKRVKPPQIIYKDRIVYRDPKEWLKTINPTEVCAGSQPLKIKGLLVNGNTKEDENLRTYMTGEVIGSGLDITCEIPGDVTGIWSEGMIVQTTRGKPY